MDHVNPKSKFHYHGIDNILTLCWDCNSSKYIKILPQNEFEEIKQYLNEVNQRFTIDEATEMGIIIKEFYNTPKKNKERRRRENWRDLALPDRDGKLRTYTIYRMRD